MTEGRIVVSQKQGQGRGWEDKAGRKVYKEAWRKFLADGYVHYFDYGDGFTCVYVC